MVVKEKIFMLTLQEIIYKLTPIFDGYNVKEAILFGSHAKGVQHDMSDIDLDVDFKDVFDGFAFFGMKASIEETLEKQVDLIAKFDIIPGERFEREIQQTGVLIYG